MHQFNSHNLQKLFTAIFTRFVFAAYLCLQRKFKAAEPTLPHTRESKLLSIMPFQTLSTKQSEVWYYQFGITRLPLVSLRIKMVWDNMRVSKWWQNFHIWMNCLFKLGPNDFLYPTFPLSTYRVLWISHWNFKTHLDLYIWVSVSLLLRDYWEIRTYASNLVWVLLGICGRMVCIWFVHVCLSVFMYISVALYYLYCVSLIKVAVLN